MEFNQYVVEVSVNAYSGVDETDREYFRCGAANKELAKSQAIDFYSDEKVEIIAVYQEV